VIDEWRFVPRVSLSHQGENFLGAGVGYMFSSEGIFRSHLVGPYVDLDFEIAGKRFLVGPKIGVEFNYIFFCSKLNCGWYMSNGTSDPRLTPEIGISLTGYLTLCYGYNIKVQSAAPDLVSAHRVTLGVNF
jgi:hypothetical protein